MKSREVHDQNKVRDHVTTSKAFLVSMAVATTERHKTLSQVTQTQFNKTRHCLSLKTHRQFDKTLSQHTKPLLDKTLHKDTDTV